jgi:hypothetical protein
MNMKNTLKNFLILSVLLLAASMSFGQTILVHTTLSAAVSTTSTTTVSLTATTGIVAGATVLFVADGPGEGMFVNSVNTTALTAQVTRGYQSLGKARTHAKSALVFIVPWVTGYPSAINTVVPSGSCTRSTTVVLPVISLGASGAPAVISDCVGGVWVNGNVAPQGNTYFHLPSPYAGSVTNNGALGTSTATVAAELYCTEIDLPYSKLLTGIAFHIGATGSASDLWIGALYDSTGNLVANSAVAGAAPGSTAYAWAAEAFTTSYYAVGPAQYYGCVMSNGTTATLDLIKTYFGDYVLTYKSASAGTFGTLPSFTAPTSFTTVYGPWLYTY